MYIALSFMDLHMNHWSDKENASKWATAYGSNNFTGNNAWHLRDLALPRPPRDSGLDAHDPTTQPEQGGHRNVQAVSLTSPETSHRGFVLTNS